MEKREGITYEHKGFCEADVVREHYEGDARGREWQEAESGLGCRLGAGLLATQCREEDPMPMAGGGECR